MRSTRHLRLGLVPALCCALGGVSAAETPQDDPRPAFKPHFYLGGGVGISSAYEVRLEGLAQNFLNFGLFFIFTEIVTTDTWDTGYQAFAGYRFNRVVAVEVAYQDLGEWSRSGTLTLFPLFPGAEERETRATQTEDARVVVLTSMLYLKKPRWLFFRVGGFGWETKTSATFESDDPEVDRTDTGGNLLLGIGGDIRPSKMFGLRLQADHYLNIGPEDKNRTLYTLNVLFRF